MIHVDRGVSRFFQVYCKVTPPSLLVQHPPKLTPSGGRSQPQGSGTSPVPIFRHVGDVAAAVFSADLQHAAGDVGRWMYQIPIRSLVKMEW